MNDFPKLTLGSTGEKVKLFKEMVTRVVNERESLSKMLFNDSDEFDYKLYLTAQKLDEAKSISFEYTDDASSYQYGTVSPNSPIYLDYYGTVDLSRRIGDSCNGWVFIDNVSNEYYLFKESNGDEYIISKRYFAPMSIIKDFTPLYDALYLKTKSREEYHNDTDTIQSLLATYPDEKSNDLLSSSEEGEFDIEDKGDISIGGNQLIQNVTGTNSQKDQSQKDSTTSQIKFPTQYPKQITRVKPTNYTYNVYNEIQAVIYDCPNGAVGVGKHHDMLLCYQQPSNVSYTASAQFDHPTPRGAQVPYNFYTGAGQIELSFTLKFHNDELYTLTEDKKTPLSLQRVAEIAENFTRPWEVDSSIIPKLVCVILPGVSVIGYMNQATIQYDGDMTGTFSENVNGVYRSYQESSGLVKDNQYQFSPVNTNYYYNSLEINFNMVVVRSITLYPQKESDVSISIYKEDIDTKNPNSESAKQSFNSEESTEVSTTKPTESAKSLLITDANSIL